MAKGMHTRVGGVWKEVVTPYAKVGGTWKEIQEGWVKQSGSWVQFYGDDPAPGGTAWTPADLGSKLIGFYDPTHSASITITNGKVSSVAPRWGSGPTLTGLMDGSDDSYCPTLNASDFGGQPSFDMSDNAFHNAISLGGRSDLGVFIHLTTASQHAARLVGMATPNVNGDEDAGGFVISCSNDGRNGYYRVAASPNVDNWGGGDEAAADKGWTKKIIGLIYPPTGHWRQRSQCFLGPLSRWHAVRRDGDYLG
jgi:hypothetical protein